MFYVEVRLASTWIDCDQGEHRCQSSLRRFETTIRHGRKHGPESLSKALTKCSVGAMKYTGSARIPVVTVLERVADFDKDPAVAKQLGRNVRKENVRKMGHT